MENVELLRAGQDGPTAIDHESIDGIVAAFDRLHECIIPVHINGIEMGRVCSLSRSGDVLLATFARVPPEAREAMVNQRFDAFTATIAKQAEYDGAHFPLALKSVDFTGVKLPTGGEVSPPLRIAMYRNARANGERVVFRWAPDTFARPMTRQPSHAKQIAAFRKATHAMNRALYRNEEKALEVTEAAVRAFDDALAAAKMKVN